MHAACLDAYSRHVNLALSHTPLAFTFAWLALSTLVLLAFILALPLPTWSLLVATLAATATVALLPALAAGFALFLHRRP